MALTTAQTVNQCLWSSQIRHVFAGFADWNLEIKFELPVRKKSNTNKSTKGSQSYKMEIFRFLESKRVGDLELTLR